MKKIYIFLIIIISFCLSLSSCTSLPVSEVTFDIDIEYESDNPAVTLEIKPSFGVYTKNSSLYESIFSDFSEDNEEIDGFYSFLCSFSNNSDSVAKIIWSNSAINYLYIADFFSNIGIFAETTPDGDLYKTSHPVCISGQKCEDSNTPMPPSIIAKKSSIAETVYSSSQIEYNTKWELVPINTDVVTFLFCISIDNHEEYITATVKAIRE